jgi:hypothetical protein
MYSDFDHGYISLNPTPLLPPFSRSGPATNPNPIERLLHNPSGERGKCDNKIVYNNVYNETIQKGRENRQKYIFLEKNNERGKIFSRLLVPHRLFSCLENKKMF